MAIQTFSIGDSVLIEGTDENGEIFKIEGEGVDRRYWIDRGLSTQDYQPGQPLIFQSEDADGAFDAIGPFTADQLRSWH